IRLKREISSYEDRVEKICQDLNYSNESLSNVLNLNLGLDMKGKIKDSLNEKVTLSTRLDAVQLQINHSQTEIEKLEALGGKIEMSLLPERDLKQLENEKEKWKNPEQIIQEKAELEDSLKINHSKAKNVKKGLLFNFIYSLVAFGFIVWAALSSEWMISVFAGLVLVYTFTNLNSLFKRLKSA